MNYKQKIILIEMLLIIFSYTLAKIFIEPQATKGFESIFLKILAIVIFSFIGGRFAIRNYEAFQNGKQMSGDEVGEIEVHKKDKPKLYLAVLIINIIIFLLLSIFAGIFLGRIL